MIRFHDMSTQVIPHFQGGEGEFVVTMVDDGCNRILKGKLAPGCSIGLHRHETSSEIIFILSGHARVICDDVTEELAPGDCHYCKIGSTHTLICLGNEDLCFYAVVPQQTCT